MFEDIQKHRQAVRENIEKSLQIGYTESEDFEKAHKVGDVHPNGKWVWTQLPSGKFDWRVRKVQPQANTTTSTASSDSSNLKIGDSVTFVHHGKKIKGIITYINGGISDVKTSDGYNYAMSLKSLTKIQASSTAAKSTSSVSSTTPKKVPSGKKINFEDDLVEVYDDKGKKVYSGILDDTPYKDYDYKWNESDKNYDLPQGYKMVGK